MYVMVGHRKLNVAIENDVCDDGGVATYGLFRPGIPDIALDLTTPATERLAVLVHEIGEAYDHFFQRGDPQHHEGKHNRTATIMAGLMKDLADQGGEIVLHRAFGDETLPDNCEGDASYSSGYEDGVDWPTTVCCPLCKVPYPDRAVSNGAPMFDWKVNGYVMARVLVCGKCERQFRVLQRCSSDGVPWPSVIAPPTSKSLIQPL
jgi:hypothetical protein